MSARTRLILAAALLLAVVAGWAAGMLVTRQTSPQPRRHRSFEKLGLTAEQREKMHEVWRSVSEWRRTHYQRRRELVKQRDEAIADLVPPPRRDAYEQILEAYRNGLEDLSAEQTRRVEEAIEKTQEFLTPEQAAKYDQLRQRRGPGSRRFGGPPLRRSRSSGEDREHRGGPESRPESQPRAQ